MASFLLPLLLQQYMVQVHTQQMRQRTRTPPPTPPPIAAAYVGAAESIVLNANLNWLVVPHRLLIIFQCILS